MYGSRWCLSYVHGKSPNSNGNWGTVYWAVIRVRLLYTFLDDVADEVVELLHSGDEYALIG